MFLSLVCIVAAALGGVFMAIRILGGHTPPWALSILHALFGALGILLLFLAVRGSGFGGAAWFALVLFVVVALGGFILASFHRRGVAHPIPLMAVHAVAAVVAFVLLVAAVSGVA